MLTGKQKHYLRGLAQTTKPLFQLGKNGLSRTYFEQIEEAIEKRELVKINLLQTTEVTVDELANFLKQHDSRIEIAQKIGRTLVIYKASRKEKYQKISTIVTKLGR
ncbi:RNA-binding protein [Latilactobacillus curvatus]|nr:RNA-binding protein [Latilactobacillus curvatus]